MKKKKHQDLFEPVVRMVVGLIIIIGFIIAMVW